MSVNKKKTSKWRVTQPPENEEIVIFSNAARPSYHFVKWAKKPNEPFYNDDWDIKLSPGFYVGPRNFENGCQFLPDVKEKEFYWMPKKEFLKKIGK